MQPARDDGARLFAHAPVTAIEATRVVTPHGTVHCARVFVAVDGRLEQLLPELAGRVRTVRLQMLATAPTAERVVRCPMYYREGYEYWQQLPDGSIALGGFRDKGGDGEWTTDGAPSEIVQQHLERFLRRVRQDFEVVEHPVPTISITRASLPEKPQILVLPGR
jgi:glycine/D-amino acid oxidase-like deaminating enzyme